jgi:uncharacterized protein YndB with AHSA1/START domain
VVAEILVAAPPARVFEAIRDPKQTAQWWGQKGMYRLTETKADVGVGGQVAECRSRAGWESF